MLQPKKNKKSNTILGKTPKPGSTLSKVVNDSFLSPDISGDGNVSGLELAAEAGMALVGGGLAKKALTKIAGKTSIKRIGSKVSKFFNNYINPADGKKISQEATSIVAKKRATLKAGGVIPKGEFGFGKSQNFANAAKKPTVPKETKYTSIDKGPTKREGYFGMSNKSTVSKAKVQLDEQIKGSPPLLKKGEPTKVKSSEAKFLSAAEELNTLNTKGFEFKHQPYKK